MSRGALKSLLLAATLLTGLSALAILLVLARTRLSVVSALIALVIPTVVVALAGAETVARVGDQGDIPRGIPLPHLPEPPHRLRHLRR